MSVDAPTESDDYVDLTDWLELCAFFSDRRRVRIDLINSAFGIGDDTYNRKIHICLLYTSPSPRDKRQSRMPSSA